MNTYEIKPDGVGWFQAIITTPDSGHWVKSGFVSQRAAQKWVDRYRKLSAKKDKTA